MSVITTFDFSKNFAFGCSSLIAIISNFKFCLSKNIFFSWYSLKSYIGHIKLSSPTTQSSIRLGVQCSFLYFIAIAYVLYMLALHLKIYFWCAGFYFWTVDFVWSWLGFQDSSVWLLEIYKKKSILQYVYINTSFVLYSYMH